MKSATLLTFSLLGALAAYFWGEFAYRTLTVLGVLRWQVPSLHTAEEIVKIEDTMHCEDAHYHAGLIFTACEDTLSTRFEWFPPLGTFTNPELAAKSKGSIHVIDPATMKSRRLRFENFDHMPAFITHGFDIISDPNQPNSIYIFVINHLPNPEWSAESPELPKARSQLEVFHHELRSESAKHIRSIWHPLIRTPNDVFAFSPTSIYVSNDHYHREGIRRILEDIYFDSKITDVIHLGIDAETLEPTGDVMADSAAGVEGTIAVPNIHNSNGLGHGRSEKEILVASCASAILNIGEISANGNITLVDEIRSETVIDNPSYFSDPFGGGPGGFVLPGIARPVELAKTARDPSYSPPKDSVMVWYATPVTGENGIKKWEQRLIFADDGSNLRSLSSAILVPIDPTQQEEKGKQQAWLFATGFVSRNMIAVKIDL